MVQKYDSRVLRKLKWYWVLVLHHRDGVSLKLDDLAGSDFATLACFELAIDRDEPLRNDLLALAAGHDEVGGLEQLAEFDVVAVYRKLHGI